MSIKSELTKTASYLRNARNAIIGRGGEISLTAGLKDLSDAIYAIPSDAALVYQTEESVAYRKSVPTDVLNFAKISKVGGMSYKSKNLVDVGTVTFDVAKTFNVSSLEVGKTYYISTRITSNDTDTTTNQIGVRYEDDTYFYPLFTRDTRVKKAFTPTKNVISMTLFAGQDYQLSAGDTATYEDFMVCEEDTDVYEPYFAGLRHTKVTEMKSGGANLAAMQNGIHNLKSYSGLETPYTAILEDGHIKIIRDPYNEAIDVSSRELMKYTAVTLPKGAYTLSFSNVKFDGFGLCILYVMYDGTEVVQGADISGGYTLSISIDKETVIKYGFYMIDGTNYAHTGTFECDVMLNRGTTAAPYKPYRAGNPVGTLAIPETVQSIDGYGVGVDAAYYNHLEFVDGKVLYHKVCGELIFNGTEDFFLNDYLKSSRGINAYQVEVIGLKGDEKPLCNSFESLNWPQNVETAVNSVWYLQDILIFITDGQQTVEEWKAQLAERYVSGNPLVAVYALVAPIVTDVSEYFTDMPFIEVEVGGTLTAVNEYEQAAPSTINYITETAGI